MAKAAKPVVDTVRNGVGAAAKAAEPVVGALQTGVRAATGSAAVERTLETVAEVTEPMLHTASAVVRRAAETVSTVAGVAEPLLHTASVVVRNVVGTVTGTVVRLAEPVLQTVGTVVDRVVRTVPDVVSALPGGSDPPELGGSPQTPSGAGDSPPAPPPLATPAPEPQAPGSRRSAGEPRRPQEAAPARQVAAETGPIFTVPVDQQWSATGAGRADSGGAPPLRPVRHAAPDGAFTGAASGASAFFSGFAMIAALFVLAAAALGKRLKLWPDLVRPPAFVSPPERPG